MTITQEPANGSIYFQKSVPDIILAQNNAETSVTFELKKGTDVILTETYLYDADAAIIIRDIYKVIEAYLSAENLIQAFSYTLTENATTHTVTFTALKCEADMTVDADSWTAQNFLTRSYREKRTSKSRNEYLSFLQKTSYGTLTVHFRVVYYSVDHWAEATGTLATIAAAATTQVTTFNASMGALVTAAGLATDSEIIQYDIWITGTGVETARYTFLSDFNQYRNLKHFVFVNCFGVLETFTATGRTDAKKTAELNMGNIDNRYRKITQDFVNEKTVNSGFLSAEEMEWIDDLILSFAVSTYTPGVTGSDEEITITNFEKTDTEANELYSFSFMIRRAKNNHRQFVNAAKGIFDDTFDETYN